MARWASSLALLALSAQIVTGREWLSNGSHRDSLAPVAAKSGDPETVHFNFEQPSAATSFDDVNSTPEGVVAEVLGSTVEPAPANDYRHTLQNLLIAGVISLSQWSASAPSFEARTTALLGLPSLPGGLGLLAGWDPGDPWIGCRSGDRPTCSGKNTDYSATIEAAGDKTSAQQREAIEDAALGGGLGDINEAGLHFLKANLLHGIPFSIDDATQFLLDLDRGLRLGSAQWALRKAARVVAVAER